MVILRYRKLKSGKYSLYLDISSTDESGISIRQTKFLQLYTDADWFGKDKIANNDRTTVFKAQEIRKQTELDLSGRLKGVKARQQTKKPSQSLSKYLTELKKTNKNARTLLSNIDKYTRQKDVRFDDVDNAWLAGFRSFLEDKEQKPNSIFSLFSTLRLAFTKAAADEITHANPFKLFEMPKGSESERTALSVDEIQRLITTPFPHHPNLRLAFLFSCFTGLRISDIYLLKWEEIVLKEGRYYLQLIPQKTSTITGAQLNVPLSISALNVLDQLEPNITNRWGKVFTKLGSQAGTSVLLKWWAALAKVDKNLYFHVARHSIYSFPL